MVQRIEPPQVADERPMLEAWLEYHRGTLAVKCEGVPPERLAERTAPPSSLTLLGLVRHMAEVERFWFREIWGAEELEDLYCSEDDRDGDFDNVEGADVDEAFASWRAACDDARRVAAGVLSLDEVAKRTRDGQGVSMRWILIHMIEEYARHNGHADLLRERLDGVVGE